MPLERVSADSEGREDELEPVDADAGMLVLGCVHRLTG